MSLDVFKKMDEGVGCGTLNPPVSELSTMADTMPGVPGLLKPLSLGSTEMTVVINVEKEPLARGKAAAPARVSEIGVVGGLFRPVLVTIDVILGAGTGGGVVITGIGVIDAVGVSTDGGSGL